MDWKRDETIDSSTIKSSLTKAEMEHPDVEIIVREYLAALKFEWDPPEDGDLKMIAALLPFIRDLLKTPGGALPVLVTMLLFLLACIQASRIPWYRIAAAHMITWLVACIITPIPAVTALLILGCSLAIMLFAKIISYIGGLHIACRIIFGILIYGSIFFSCYVIFGLAYTEKGQFLLADYRLHQTIRIATVRLAKLRAENPNQTFMEWFS
jgi:hypothetical protein